MKENIVNKYKNVFMIGIGGISMSGIAEIIKAWGINISGSNNTESKITKHLMDIGIDVKIGHDERNITNQDLVIYTAAIPVDNPELQKAKELGIPTMERADFVGEMTKYFDETICISGTHGKSTTSSMISSCFLQAKLDPTIQIGAELNLINGNFHVGKNKYFILEACEYVDSFLKFYPKTEIILNIDNDHLNYFKNLDNIKKSFTKYINLLPANGLLIINDDDENCKDIYKDCKGKIIKYSIKNNTADYYATNIKFNDLGFPTFDVYHNCKYYLTVTLSVLGIHNVSNALATVALCNEYKIDNASIIEGLKSYTGVGRRFEYIGTYNENVLVYDDYAHHPTEIATTVDSVNCIKHRKSWAIFQPHTYSRTKEHYEEFGHILANFDYIIIAEIYAARETNIYNIKEEDIVSVIKRTNPNAKVILKYDDIVAYLKENVKPDDLVITIGAGPVNEVGLKLINN
ncbi:MAG: UDP-N-acetylmuramate--L-alanine ligase [Bacilli bacterium]|nr:UDP-N-acetylmuramate--L-alanine ligase [Bacilli bacterium]